MVDTTDVEHYLGCPQHAHKPSAVLLAHSEQAALPSYQKAIDNHANKTVTPDSASVSWTISLTLLYSQVIPVNIDVIDPSQPVTSLYSQVTPVNIDPINLSQPVTLQIPQATSNKRAHNEAHGLLSDIDNSHEDAQLNPKPKGMCTFLLNIQSLLYLLHLAKRLCQEENLSKVEAIDNNGIFINIDGVLIDINSVLIDIDSVLIDIDSVLININGVLINIKLISMFSPSPSSQLWKAKLPIQITSLVNHLSI
jgi:hypothetical protein